MSGGTGRRGSWGSAFAGMLLIGVGVVLLLAQLDYLEFRSVWHYWPALLMILGVWKLIAPAADRDVAEGVGWLILGVWIMACMERWGGLSFRNSWPLVFVSLGIQIMLKAVFPTLKEQKHERAKAAKEAAKAAAASAATASVATVAGEEADHV